MVRLNKSQSLLILELLHKPKRERLLTGRLMHRRKLSKKYIQRIGILVIFVIAAIFFGVIYYFETYTPSQNNQALLKKLPPDIKKAIANPPVPSTSSATLRIPILMYHYVENVTDPKDKIRKSLAIPPAIFSLQLQTLKNDGYTFMNMAELADVIDGKTKLPQKGVVLTFDDGYRDFYTDVFPILEQYNIKAVSYVISGFINKPNYMFDWQIKELIKSKLVEIGAHTLHHPDLSRLPFNRLQLEVSQSKSDLESEFGIPVVSFAYPYGSFNTSAIDAVRAAGFRSATTTLPGIIADNKNRFYLYRIRPGYRTGIFLLNYLSQDSFKPW